MSLFEALKRGFIGRAVETEIVECFRRGGGVPYERYPRFHEVKQQVFRDFTTEYGVRD